MANYQPNYIYSPLYGNRYMGGSRTPAPSTGNAGQVDTSAIQSRNTAVGVPYSPVVEEQPLGPVGWSSTGRDQSAVESLGTFGFRNLNTLQQDPFEGTDYLTQGFGSPSPINTSFVAPVPEQTPSPAVAFSGSDGGNETNPQQNIYAGQGMTGPSSYSGEFSLSNPMDVGWGLYSVGRDLPPLAQALVPGVQAAQFVGGQILDQEIDRIDDSYTVMNTVPSNVVTSSDEFGNVYASGYKPDSVINESNTNLSAAQFSQLSNSLPEGASVQGVDASGNVNVTMPDGTTARAGVSPNTGQVNTYNFNVNDTVTYSDSDKFRDDTDGDQFGGSPSTSSTQNTAASEDAYSAPAAAPQTNDELDADSADSGSDSGGK